MQNIDPLFILQPIVVIIVCTAILVYWRLKRRFHLIVLVYSLLAYAMAIALKEAVQLPTINTVIGTFGAHSAVLGAYYGLQTVIFEVGLAYLVAWYAFNHGAIGKKDAEAYGSGLAFWENAGLLGVLPLLSLIVDFSILSTNTPLAQTVYDQLSKNAPGLFASASQALPSIALGIVERTSSTLFHVAWGYLCVMAAVYKKKRLFLIALPMGFVDFLVPLTISEHIVLFESVVLGLAVLSAIVAWYMVRHTRESVEGKPFMNEAGASNIQKPYP